MQTLRRLLALVVCGAVIVSAQGNSFDKVRYDGGSVATKVKPDDWGNRLTVTPDTIALVLKDGQSITIPSKQVTGLSYGEEAHRRVGLAIGLAVFSLGIGALSALHKTKLHYIGVTYVDADGKKGGILLQGDKSNFRAILVALQGVTGVPVAVGEKDREEIPVGVATQVSKESENGKEKVQPNSDSANSNASTLPATVSVSSTPDGADIFSDGAFVGNAPANLKLSAGKHTVKVSMTGYKDWSRDITAQAGSEVRLTAILEKLN
jgi:hypothetical protein